VKRFTHSMRGVKSLLSASWTIMRVELMSAICEGELARTEHIPETLAERFSALAV